MRLYEIQQKLKAPKSQYNSFGKYHYRNCEDILEALKPLLGDSVLTLSDEIVNVGDRYYVRAKAELYEGEPGNSICHTAYAYAREALDRKGMDDSQITGAASSYARKYALNGLFLIDDTKDADSDEGNEASKPPQKATVRKGMGTNGEKERIQFLLKSLGHTPKTKGEAEATVLELTSLELKPENFEEIANRLALRLEETDPTK